MGIPVVKVKITIDTLEERSYIQGMAQIKLKDAKAMLNWWLSENGYEPLHRKSSPRKFAERFREAYTEGSRKILYKPFKTEKEAARYIQSTAQRIW